MTQNSSTIYNTTTNAYVSMSDLNASYVQTAWTAPTAGTGPVKIGASYLYAKQNGAVLASVTLTESGPTPAPTSGTL